MIDESSLKFVALACVIAVLVEIKSAIKLLNSFIQD